MTEFSFYAMKKNNKDKGKKHRPIPLTKYTNMLVGQEKKKSFTDVVEFYKKTGLLPVMNDASVEKAVKWYLYDLRTIRRIQFPKPRRKKSRLRALQKDIPRTGKQKPLNLSC